MAIRKPIVLVDGQLQRIQAGDTLEGASTNVDFTGTNGNTGSITVGQAVYIKSNGDIDLAMADASATAKVVGVVADATIATGTSGNIRTSGALASADWTTVTGSATLTPGERYYLDNTSAGMLTATPPDATGEFVVAVGMALSTTELLVEVARPIKA